MGFRVCCVALVWRSLQYSGHVNTAWIGNRIQLLCTVYLLFYCNNIISFNNIYSYVYIHTNKFIIEKDLSLYIYKFNPFAGGTIITNLTFPNNLGDLLGGGRQYGWQCQPMSFW